MDFVINGAVFGVGFAALTRSYRKEEKYRVTTEDGKIHREVRAVYADFSLSLGNVDAAEYDRLMGVIVTESQDLTVSLPSGGGEVQGYTGVFDSVTDGVLLENEDGVYWDNLELAFTGTVPLEVGAT